VAGLDDFRDYDFFFFHYDWRASLILTGLAGSIVGLGDADGLFYFAACGGPSRDSSGWRYCNGWASCRRDCGDIICLFQS